MKTFKRFMGIILSFVFVFSLCSCNIEIQYDDLENDPIVGPIVEEVTQKYNEGVVLVKYAEEITDEILSQLNFISAERLYPNSLWYKVVLPSKENTKETVDYLRELGCFEEVDFDYVMGTDGEVDSIDVSHNPGHGKQPNFDVHKVKEGWKHQKDNDLNPGGSEDVIVAVIDTGVDYNHLDLRNNIWVNSGEIPNNGKDDDGNGYIDDVYGWNFVGNNKNPMDDNGHGTHVAGIIAAENNDIGGVGVAYNCKVMVLKAGNSSGYFNNSDIAEAIQYAYMNGASVINMSFGGSSISLAVEEALEDAYNSCVLVAAAGNDSCCNNTSCKLCLLKGVSYPAALPYVIGVMSCNKEGTRVSSFSNYDHYAHNTVEYEVYACGENVYSTFPNNKYASLNGTSMAAPTVSAIAALLRSSYTDRDAYSTKYLVSQIVNTGTVNPYNMFTELTDNDHSVANVYEALTKIPTPSVNLHDYYIDDSTSISENNNGNGQVDAGETIRLYVSLINKGGVATNVKVSIDTLRTGGVTDPYFDIKNDSVTLSDIGTYSVREAYEDQYFEIVVSSDCPNDYLVDLNVHFTYENGLDESDTTIYTETGKPKAQFNVSRGYYLPTVISEDTTYYNDKLYIVNNDVVIPAGVTVTFEEGCQIQFYTDEALYNSPVIKVYGHLYFNGTKENMINIFPNEKHYSYLCRIFNYSEDTTINLNYVNAINLSIDNPVYYYTYNCIINNSILKYQSEHYQGYVFNYSSGSASQNTIYFESKSINNSIVDFSIADQIRFTVEIFENNRLFMCGGGNQDLSASTMNNNYINTYYCPRSAESSITVKTMSNNIFVTDNSDLRDLVSISIKNKTDSKNNFFDETYKKYASSVIDGYIDSSGNVTIDINSNVSDPSLLYPHITSIDLFNADGEKVTKVGKEEITYRVTFNRDMDTTKDTAVYFGTKEPFADYKVEGEYISSTVWEGKYSLKADIENGLQTMIVKNACAAEDETKEVSDTQKFHFTIDTTEAMAMNLIANPTEQGINLTWAQDDYDTLLGYNIYRSSEKDGLYTKINPTILLPSDETFLDENAEPGVTYWYTFTVVLSDFSESTPAGKVTCTAADTIAPTLYHITKNQGYTNNNLVISCTASDNISISKVTLFYRTYGQTSWKSLEMSKVNNKYNATIFGSELSIEGLEYYIVASDGNNTVSKGNENSPYYVVIKDASDISQKGDVDGDGVITTKDALMIIQCINGDFIMKDEEFKRADLNGDNVLSSAEALRILQYINGKVTTLDM